MSCIELVDKYAEEEAANKKDQIVDEVLDCFHAQEELRTQALHDFIDDFVNSQEYANYIRDKRKLIRRCKASQYDPNDILVEYKKNDQVEKYPLTEEQKKMFAFKQRFEEYAERQRRELEVKKQEQSIQIIKSKINEARTLFECTRQYKQMQSERRELYLLEKYSARFGIDFKCLTENTQSKLVERFKKCHQISSLRKKRKRENVYRMIEKLLFEYKIDKQQIARKKELKNYYKMKTKERIIEGMEVVGTKINVIDPEEPKTYRKVESSQDQESLIELKDVKKKKKTELPKDATDGKDKAGKKEKKNGEKKDVKEKKAKEKKEKSEAKLYIPVIPMVNRREKLLPENIDKMLDLVDEFREFDNAMENSDMWHTQRNFLLEDSELQFKPGEIRFHDFDEGKTYSRALRVTNASPQIRKIRFLKFEFPDEYDEVVFEVTNVGIRKLYTGCSVKFSIKFEPYDTFKSYEGKIVFLSYDIRLCQYFQLEVGIKCVPKYSDLKIYPEVVQFGYVPIWEADVDGHGKHFKIIKLKNQGTKSCTICIRKLSDPLDVEQILDDDDNTVNKENLVPAPKNSATDFQVVYDVLDECLRNVADNNFQFEQSFFILRQFEEKRVKVFFKNASYIGCYFEKYTVDVYEVFGNGCLDTAGCKTISFHAETTGHFLTTSPEILDFGTCVINSCYQLSFDMHNDSDKSQAISVRVPSSLTDVVLPDIATAYMPAQSKRTVFVKLSPRLSIIRNICPYFDQSSSILEFPIQLHVVSRASRGYPPVRVTVYAVVANFEDLTISCNHTGYLSNFLNTLLIDMGDCSIYESVWTEISLTNNTFVTQICGFIDLPDAVVLVPNFGFCKLYPGQRKKFKLYLSPEIKDYPSFVIGSLRNSTYFLKLTVETVVSLGQLQREINPKRLIRSMDIMLKQLTTTDLLSTSITGFVNDLKEHFEDGGPATQSMVNKEDFFISRVCSLMPERLLGTQDTTYPDSKSMDGVLNYQNFLIVETYSRKEVWVKTNLKRPLLEFSHQTVEFPDTPCGSYSVMEVSLHALERDIEKVCSKKKTGLTYRARFQIFGASDEILVEPTCGTLNAGEIVQESGFILPEVCKNDPKVAQSLVPKEL